MPSEERFGNVKVGQGNPPKHTSEGHEHCLYYLTDVLPEAEDGTAILGMVCPHGVAANGGFASEDYINELRQAGQKFLTEVDGLLLGHPNPSILLPSIEKYRETFK